MGPRSFHGKPFSTGSPRSAGLTGTDWPLLEEPFVDVVDHLELLPSSHVHPEYPVSRQKHSMDTPVEFETPNRPTSSGLQSLESRYNLVQVHQLKSMFDKLHVVYLQLNGEIYMLEKEMMDVNYLATCPKLMI